MISEDSFKNIRNTEKKEKSFLSKFIFNIFIKSLVVIILFLVSLIYIKKSDNNKEKLKKIVYTNNLSFAKIYNVYEKYLGDVIPFKNIFKDNTKLVSEEKITYSDIKKSDNGYILDVTDNYMVLSIYSGIVINTDKENNIITIQNKEGLNISYGLLTNINVNLYDYIEKGEIIGIAEKKLYLEFMKDDKYLSYEEYI